MTYHQKAAVLITIVVIALTWYRKRLVHAREQDNARDQQADEAAGLPAGTVSIPVDGVDTVDQDTGRRHFRYDIDDPNAIVFTI